MVNSRSVDLDEVEKIINPLIGLKAFNASLGVGSMVTVDFSSSGLPENTSIYHPGEFHLWVYMGAWRIEKEDIFLAGASDSRPIMESAIDKINGLKVKNIQILPPYWDTNFIFEKQLSIRLFSTSTEEECENFLLFTSQKYIIFGPGKELTIEIEYE